MGKSNRRSFLQVAGAAVLSGHASRLLGRSTVESGAEASPNGARRPNILFLFPDQYRYDWVSGYAQNLPVQTPNLTRLAKDGVWFRRACVPSPLCAPSRACLASGREYPRCGVASNQADYPLTQTTVYSLLQSGGYHVAGCGKIDLHKKTPEWSLDGKRLLKEWGFSDGIDNAGKWDAITSGRTAPHDPYMAYLYRRGLAAEHIADFLSRSGATPDGCPKMYAQTSPTPLPDDAYCDNWVGRNGLELMDKFPKDKPWFLAVNFTGPHNPEDITRRMETLVRGRVFPQPIDSKICSPETHELIRQNYTAMVENIDGWVGIYLDKLRERGELENTIVIFSSDHGEMLGDHNLWGKTQPYQPSVGVPLIVAGPGVKPRAPTDVLVTTLDFTATFLDYAGVSRPDDMDSRSLRPFLEDRTQTHREFVCSALGQWRMAFDGRYKLITGFARGRVWPNKESPTFVDPLPTPLMVFDLENDPTEQVNLAAKVGSEVRKLTEMIQPGA
jgi:arylsulfatase A-like enzyme